MRDHTNDRLPDAVTGETHDRIIKGHSYDGIKEYDNPMPGWWVWGFVGTVVFSVVYFFGIEVFGFVDTYEDDLEEGLAELALVRQAYAEANPTFEVDAAALARYVEDPSMREAGAITYTAQCASCHGDAGQGLIGPNLTDPYWIHGGSDVDIFRVITEGVAAKGMPPWEAVLTPEQRAELVAFIRGIEGTTPAGGKVPQGELHE